ncbi:MFS transporter [Streptomyces sp. NPDC086080]|uniref:MFS transporter n=1 Tax=Streptomyces sp. NPDC086080 TaxID=3365748 RepID=UPI0037CE205E
MKDIGRGRRQLSFWVLTLSAMAFSSLQSLLVPVLPHIERLFHTDQRTVVWVVTAYLLSASIFTPVLGRVGDMVGKRRVLVATLAALTVGSALAALAPSLGWLIAARVIQGAGGGVMPLTFGIIRDLYHEAHVSRAVGVLAAVGSLGYGAGIVAAGPVVDVLGYPWLFWLPTITTAAAAVAARFVIPESPVRGPRGLPLLPALLLSVGLVSLLVALSQGTVRGWLSPGILALVALSVLAGTAWIWTEGRVPVPMIDMTMMRRRGVWSANCVSALLGFGMFAGFAFLPQLMQTPPEAGYGFGSTIAQSGQLMLPSALAMFAVGFATAPLIRRFGSRAVTVAGSAVGALAYLALAAFHDTPWQACAAMTVLGLGIGLVFTTVAGVVVRAVPPEQTGVAGGMNANIRTIGGSFGAAAMGAIVTGGVSATGHPPEAAYTAGFATLGVALALGSVLALFVPSPDGQPVGGPGHDAAPAGPDAVHSGRVG